MRRIDAVHAEAALEGELKRLAQELAPWHQKTRAIAPIGVVEDARGFEVVTGILGIDKCPNGEGMPGGPPPDFEYSCLILACTSSIVVTPGPLTRFFDQLARCAKAAGPRDLQEPPSSASAFS